MPLSPKDVVCKCGHVTTLAHKRLMCVKCGKYVFYNEQEARSHRTNTIYTYVMFLAAIGLVAYLFIEMIVNPLLG